VSGQIDEGVVRAPRRVAAPSLTASCQGRVAASAAAASAAEGHAGHVQAEVGGHPHGRGRRRDGHGGLLMMMAALMMMDGMMVSMVIEAGLSLLLLLVLRLLELVELHGCWLD